MSFRNSKQFWLPIRAGGYLLVIGKCRGQTSGPLHVYIWLDLVYLMPTCYPAAMHEIAPFEFPIPNVGLR